MEAITAMLVESAEFRAGTTRVEKLYMEDPRMTVAGIPWARHVKHMHQNTRINKRILEWIDYHKPLPADHCLQEVED